MSLMPLPMVIAVMMTMMTLAIGVVGGRVVTGGRALSTTTTRVIGTTTITAVGVGGGGAHRPAHDRPRRRTGRRTMGGTIGITPRYPPAFLGGGVCRGGGYCAAVPLGPQRHLAAAGLVGWGGVASVPQFGRHHASRVGGRAALPVDGDVDGTMTRGGDGANPDDSSDAGEERPHQPMDNLYREWSVEEDTTLHRRRDEPVPKLASILGRGLGGVTSRLDKLRDVDSPAYARLFAGCGGGGGGGVDGDEDVDFGTKNGGGRGLTPAAEVLRRIRWDGTLDPSDFSVVHYDRVEDSLLEVPFGATNDSVGGSERLFVFAIPEHRIASVRYRERTVWDREARVDRVFGSMNGDGETIDAVVRTYDEWKTRRDEAAEANRRRQIEVASRVRSFLGGDRFEVLRDMSDRIRAADGGGDEKGAPLAVRRYVEAASRLFDEARREGDGDDGGGGGVGSSELDALDLLSELVATLPDAGLRERVLFEISGRVDRAAGGGDATTRRGGGGRNSAVSPLPELDEDDLTEKFVRGSGPGGQKMNKTSSRVILMHEPTQLRVECQDTRSLQQNRKIARKRMRLKLDEHVNGERSRTNVRGAAAAKKKSRARARNRARRRRKKEEGEAAAATSDES